MESFFTGRLKALTALLVLTMILYAATRPAADQADVAEARPAGLRDAPAQLSLRPEQAPAPERRLPERAADPQALRSPSPEAASALEDAMADLDAGLAEELDLLPAGPSPEEILALREAGLDVDEVGYALSVSGSSGQAMRTFGHRIETRRSCHHAPC